MADSEFMRSIDRGVRKRQIMKMVKKLDGLEIRVGFQGNDARAPVQKRVEKRKGKAKDPSGRQRKVPLTIPTSEGAADPVPADGRRARNTRTRARRKAVGSMVVTDPDLTVVVLATIHEFGSPKARIPERSFMRSTFRDNRAGIQKLTKRIVQAAMAGQDPDPLAVQTGLRLAAGVKKKITDLRDPPLAVSTRLRRYRLTGDLDPNPLVDTGQLRASVSSIVLRKGKAIAGQI